MSSWKILGINHVGLAPKDPAKARNFLGDALGLDFAGEELVPTQKTNTIMFESVSAGQSHREQGRLEILENQPGTDGPIAKFLAKKGSGIHHVAVTVDHCEAAIADLLSKGVKMIDETPRPGSHNTRVAFIHPEATGGLLIELVEQLSN
jgi:methylmalonyl-CoA/ethylmalonyl-CoA epimerase